MFRRSEVRETGGAFLYGLLSGVSLKTGWMVSEPAVLSRPWRMLALLGCSRWDAHRIRDEVRDCVVEAIGCDDGVLVVDGTGFLKKVTHSVGVARQSSGTTGRTESCQVGVFPGYAVRHGQALIDHRLYSPRVRVDDTERRTKTGVPDDVGFATKLAIARNLDAGVRCAWVLADAAYGCDHSLRRKLEERGQPYVLAVRSNHHLRFVDDSGIVVITPSGIAEDLDGKGWTALAAGEGPKGIRLSDMPVVP